MTQIDRVLKKDVDEQWSRVIEALFIAPSRRQAAELAGVSPSTLYRLLQDQAFRDALADAEQVAISQSVTRLIAEFENSIDAVIRLRKDGFPCDSVKLKSALAILDRGIALRESLQVEQRLDVLENIVAQLAERI